MNFKKGDRVYIPNELIAKHAIKPPIKPFIIRKIEYCPSDGPGCEKIDCPGQVLGAKSGGSCFGYGYTDIEYILRKVKTNLWRGIKR